MRNLPKYVEQLNFSRKLMKQPLLDADNLSLADIDGIVARLNSDFSPENLTHDGELSRAEVQKRHKFLSGVVYDLTKMGHNVQLEF